MRQGGGEGSYHSRKDAKVGQQDPPTRCSIMHWHALACTGMHWHALACTGMHWHALACTGMQRYWIQGLPRRLQENVCWGGGGKGQEDYNDKTAPQVNSVHQRSKELTPPRQGMPRNKARTAA
jgi:hypothetical protein